MPEKKLGELDAPHPVDVSDLKEETTEVKDIQLIRQSSREYLATHTACNKCGSKESSSLVTLHCDHTYCAKCVAGLLVEQSTDKALPPQCLVNTCGRSMVADDLFLIVKPEQLATMLRNATQQYRARLAQPVACSHDGCGFPNPLKTKLEETTADGLIKIRSDPKHTMRRLAGKLVQKCGKCTKDFCGGCGKPIHKAICPEANFILTGWILDNIQDLDAVGTDELPGVGHGGGGNNELHTGVGYGGDSGGNDEIKEIVDQTEEREKVRDTAVAHMLSCLRLCLLDPLLTRTVPAFYYGQLFHSRLNNRLAQYLATTSMVQIARRRELYARVLDLCVAMSSKAQLVSLLGPDGTNMEFKLDGKTEIRRSLLKQLTAIRQQAEVMTDGNGPLELKRQKSMDEEDLAFINVCESFKVNVREIEQLAKTFMRNARTKFAALLQKKEELKIDLPGPKDVKKRDDEKKVEVSEEEVKVREYLDSMRMGMVNLMEHDKYTHAYSACAVKDKEAVKSKKRSLAIRKELASFGSDLPPGIFVRVDAERMDVLHALIIGAEGTPYANGCFLFDIYLPPEYPDVPPKVSFLTTGKATFRFNANLYTCGKVCLSLLGTWDGPGWEPGVSTILQVLLSIQAMIMCEAPFINEPGWLRYRQTAPHREKHFDRSVRHATLVYALCWHLEEPAHFFRDVIQAHMYLNRRQIIAQAEQWLEDSKVVLQGSPSDNYGGATVVNQMTMAAAVKKLKDDLTVIKPPAMDVDDDDDDS